MLSEKSSHPEAGKTVWFDAPIPDVSGTGAALGTARRAHDGVARFPKHVGFRCDAVVPLEELLSIRPSITPYAYEPVGKS